MGRDAGLAAQDYGHADDNQILFLVTENTSVLDGLAQFAEGLGGFRDSLVERAEFAPHVVLFFPAGHDRLRPFQLAAVSNAAAEDRAGPFGPARLFSP
nr:hypothetical protein [Stappia indica]